MTRTLLAISMLLGCSAERPQAVYLAPRAVESSSLPTSTKAIAQGGACLMLYECGCNAGCLQIDRSLDSINVGMQVGVVGGALKGTTVFVVKNRTDDGTSVFTVQRADPSDPIVVCGAPRAPLVAYGCGRGNSGAARACRTCEGE